MAETRQEIVNRLRAVRSVANRPGSRRRRRSRLPMVATTRNIERDYARRLLELVQVTTEELEILIAELPSLIESARIDALIRLDVGESEKVRGLIAQARERIRNRLSTNRLTELATEFATQTSEFSRRQLDRQLRSALGIDIFHRDPRLLTIVENFAARNVSLARNIPDKLLSDVEEVVVRGLRRGTSSRSLAQQIRERTGVGERRAQLIARDQVSRLNGQINAARQVDLGIEEFTWQTMQDERVRPEHQERQGVRYRFDDPPDGELPGEPINCRCWADPVLDSILAEAQEG